MAVLVVQMGHVGRTTGATGAPGEQQLTQRVGDACARLLNREGWTVRLVPADPPLSSYRGDAFCAFHADGNNNPSVAGASVGYQTSEGGSLAHGWADAWRALGYAGRWNADNYTTNLAQYYGVRAAVGQGCRRAFIAEVGTITNPDDRAYITSPQGIDRAAYALGMALGMHFDPRETDMDVNDPQFQALAWKAQAIVYDQPRLEGGPVGVIGTENKLHTHLVAIDNQQAATQQSLAALKAKVDQIAVGNIDYPTLVKMLADELDRRARDGDPTTGPTT